MVRIVMALRHLGSGEGRRAGRRGVVGRSDGGEDDVETAKVVRAQAVAAGCAAAIGAIVALMACLHWTRLMDPYMWITAVVVAVVCVMPIAAVEARYCTFQEPVYALVPRIVVTVTDYFLPFGPHAIAALVVSAVLSSQARTTTWYTALAVFSSADLLFSFLQYDNVLHLGRFARIQWASVLYRGVYQGLLRAVALGLAWVVFFKPIDPTMPFRHAISIIGILELSWNVARAVLKARMEHPCLDASWHTDNTVALVGLIRQRDVAYTRVVAAKEIAAVAKHHEEGRRCLYQSGESSPWKTVLRVCEEEMLLFCRDMDYTIKNKEIPLSSGILTQSEGQQCAHLFRNTDTLQLCIQMLSELAIHAPQEDAYGVIHGTGPMQSLLSVLLSCDCAIEDYLRYAKTGPRHVIRCRPLALQRCLHTSLRRILQVYAPMVHHYHLAAPYAKRLYFFCDTDE